MATATDRVFRTVELTLDEVVATTDALEKTRELLGKYLASDLSPEDGFWQHRIDLINASLVKISGQS